LSLKAQGRLQSILQAYERLRVAYSYKQSLQAVWLKTASSQKELVDALQQWCKQAEQSGMEYLENFAKQVRSYIPQAATVSS